MQLYEFIWTQMFTAWDNCLSIDLAWMPAHTGEADVGRLLLSNGRPLSDLDRASNAEAHRLAKDAA